MDNVEISFSTKRAAKSLFKTPITLIRLFNICKLNSSHLRFTDLPETIGLIIFIEWIGLSHSLMGVKAVVRRDFDAGVSTGKPRLIGVTKKAHIIH